MNKVTRFMDMYSGGPLKTEWEYIYIEAAYDKAVTYFNQRFGRSPFNVTCQCCGDDFAVREAANLYQASGFERGCMFDRDLRRWLEIPSNASYYMTIDKWLASDKVLFIPESEVTAH